MGALPEYPRGVGRCDAAVREGVPGQPAAPRHRNTLPGLPRAVVTSMYVMDSRSESGAGDLMQNQPLHLGVAGFTPVWLRGLASIRAAHSDALGRLVGAD